MSKLNFYNEYLPRKIAKVLKEITVCEREYRTHDNYLLVVGLVYRHQMSDDASYLHYSPLSREYWRTVVGSHYSKYIERLVQEKVLQRDWVQYVDDFGNSSRVMGYRINPDFLQDDFTLIKYSGAKSQSASADMLHSKAIGGQAIGQADRKSVV
jgi:hypothetical protein